MYKRVKEPIHFVGIGGIGMSGIAEVLFRLGFPVSGSDVSESSAVLKLRDLGIKISIGHAAQNLGSAKVLVVSSAISPNNPELLEAKRRGYPIVPRAEMLAELMRLKYGVAIAGTHGKTTTTSMLASILTAAKLDPTVIVGGKVGQLGGNAKLGGGQFLVAEADESDGSFLKLSPVLTVITNIDNDHLDYYGHMERLRLSFLQFANKVPYYGRCIVCFDDPEVQKLLPLIERPLQTYGFLEGAEFQIRNFSPHEKGSQFDVYKGLQKLCSLKLPYPGQHNALNATAALAAALDLDVTIECAIEALESFQGVGRRFELKGILKNGNVPIIDDYGHHPTEIAATLKAAKQYWSKGRVVVAFQPHRFSRTQLCWDQFPTALEIADRVFILDIYAAGESPIPGIASQELVSACSPQNSHKFEYAGSLDQASQLLSQELRAGDLLVTLGAGSITQLGPQLLKSN